MLLWMALAAAAPSLDATLDELGRLQPALQLVQRVQQPFEVSDGATPGT